MLVINAGESISSLRNRRKDIGRCYVESKVLQVREVDTADGKRAERGGMAMEGVDSRTW